MHPILFQWGPFEFRSYGLMLSLSFILGIYWTLRRAERRGIERPYIIELSVIVILCAIAGARLLWVLTHVQHFQGRWLDTFNPLQSTGKIGISGLTLLGGFILSLAAIFIYCRIRQIPFFRLMDAAAPCMALGIALTRIGCFLNGCCFGKPGDLPWCLVFPFFSPAGSVLQGLRLHPTQLYSALYGIVILIILMVSERRARPDGFLTGMFLISYGIFRMAVDFIRYYESSVQFSLMGIRLNVNQIICIGMIVAGFIILLVLKRSVKRSKMP